MSKRLVCLLWCLSVVPAWAQETPRIRWARPETPVTVPVNPIVEVTVPTNATTFTTPSSSIEVRGTVESPNGKAITSVTWSCPTCTPTSGTALLSPNNTWLTPVSSGGGTVFFHDFEGASNVDLDLIAPNTGTSWAVGVNNTGNVEYALSRRTGGYVMIKNQLGGGTPLVFDIASPDPSGANYDVSSTIEIAGAGFDDPGGIVFGYADSANWCAAVLYPSTTPSIQAYLIKKVAGTITTLDSDAVTWATNDVVKVSVRTGGVLELFQNGVSRLTATDTFCDDANTVGFGVGSFRAVSGEDLSNGWHFLDFTVVDQDGASSGIGLASGANVITFTVTDEDSATGTDAITITREAADSVDPVVLINSPTDQPTYATSTSTLTPGGTCTDNVAPFVVTLACATCTPTSRTATLTGTSWVADAAFTLAAGSNSIVATCQDAAGNDHTDTLTATYTAVDATAPVVTITTNGGSNFSTGATPTTIAGTCTDAVGCTQIFVACSGCTIGTITGLGSWSVPVNLASGANVVSVTARDEAGNVSSADSITVTYSAGTLAITSTSAPSGRVGTAYTPASLAATGGTTPYAWSNNGAGTSLNDADAHCAGLVISSAGVISGTPTTEGTCDWTAKVTDNVAATDTQALSIAVLAAGAEGPHDYFSTMLARSDCYKAWSLRPVDGQSLASVAGNSDFKIYNTDCTHAYHEGQLGGSTSQGHRKSFNLARGYSKYLITYAGCPTCTPSQGYEADPGGPDAAKVRIPAFFPACPNDATSGALAASIDADDTVITRSCGWDASATGKRVIKIDNEYMLVVPPQAVSGLAPVTVQRGYLGSTPAPHTAGTEVYLSVNSLFTNDQLNLPILNDGADNVDVLVGIDFYAKTPGWEGWGGPGGNTAYKLFNIGSGSQDRNFIEYQPNFDACDNAVLYQYEHPDCVYGVDSGSMSFRYYSVIHSTPQAYPAYVNNPSLMQMNKWQRFWMLIEQRDESDPANYDDTVTTLNQAMNSSQTTMVVNYPASTFTVANGSDAFYTPLSTTGGINGRTRAVKIDSELIMITDCVSPNVNPRTCNVVRGAYGTTPAAHLAAANVTLHADYVTVWHGDEDTDAVKVWDRKPTYLTIRTGDNNTTNEQKRPLLTNQISGNLGIFFVEFDTSAGDLFNLRVAQGFTDWIFYLRNVFVLQNSPGTDYTPIITGIANRPKR